jgi:hypothetical protein
MAAQEGKKDYFSSVKIQKGTDFPSLDWEEDGCYIKLEAGEGPAWRNKVTGRCGSNAMHKSSL